MFKKWMLFVLAQGLTVPTVSWAANCLLADLQQQTLILSEGPKALNDGSSNECFNGMVKDEMAVLSEGESPLAGDSEFAIHSLMHSALERYSFDRTQAE